MTSVPLMINDDCEYGGKNSDSIEDDFAFKNNVLQASKDIRLAFIRKVYGLLSVQLLATFAIGTVFSCVEPVKLYIKENNVMIIVALVLSLVILVPLYIYRKQSPANLYLLAAFTVVEAYSVGVVVSFYDQMIVLEALFLTLAVVIGITAYTFNTKKDFSSMYSGLFAGLCILLVAGIMQIFIQNTFMELLISVGGALLFSLFIVFDTHMLMEKLSPEEYIFATINLYLDIINLFLHILRILQIAQKN